jgi:hypothetical protein
VLAGSTAVTIAIELVVAKSGGDVYSCGCFAGHEQSIGIIEFEFELHLPLRD